MHDYKIKLGNWLNSTLSDRGLKQSLLRTDHSGYITSMLVINQRMKLTVYKF